MYWTEIITENDICCAEDNKAYNGHIYVYKQAIAKEGHGGWESNIERDRSTDRDVEVRK